ncbi:hypothetical protein SDC9_208026 [bioreactor metagenome]|uniref:Uncharacterized protein n=1 Tax=bioreactor metagenome TaxID=1076179 RepID=A0A645J9F6_9ZZZZ
MCHPAFGCMGICPSQLFLGQLFVCDRFDYIRAGDKHITFFLHHKDEIGKGRGIARTTGTWPQDSGDLGHHTRSLDILIEDIGITAKGDHSFLDTGSARIVQCDDRSTVLHCQLLYFDNLIGIGTAQ